MAIFPDPKPIPRPWPPLPPLAISFELGLFDLMFLALGGIVYRPGLDRRVYVRASSYVRNRPGSWLRIARSCVLAPDWSSFVKTLGYKWKFEDGVPVTGDAPTEDELSAEMLKADQEMIDNPRLF